MLKEQMIVTGSQMFTKKATFEKGPETGKKAYRADEISSSVVTVNGIEYDSDETAMDRMARVLSVASWRYNQAIAAGSPQTAAYQAVYVDNTIPWKAKNNSFQVLTIEQLGEVQEAALYQLAQTWVTYG